MNAMSERESETLGFREWTTHYEREQEADREKLTSLTEAVSTINSNVGALTANVNTLMDNQKGLYNRVNRPANWGIFATFAAVIFMVVALVVGGIRENIVKIEAHQAKDIQRNLDLHIWMRTSIDKNNQALAGQAADLAWIKTLEDRMSRRKDG
jgi:hypothetical protein